MSASPQSTEDKLAWCAHGVALEEEFVARFGERLGVRMNPEKATNKYAPDLLDQAGLADLKSQHEPFYRAASHRMNPLQCVSFNRKDAVRYYENYPKLNLYFWLRFEGGTRFGVSVPQMEAVYFLSLTDLIAQLTGGLAPLHHYQRRGDDPVNATCSYLLDTNLMRQLIP